MTRAMATATILSGVESVTNKNGPSVGALRPSCCELPIDGGLDCMLQFRAAWDRLSSDPARLTEFLEMKRKRLR